MKTLLKNLILVLALLASLTQTARAAVTFSVAPAAVSNTWNGNIALQISGLTNTETVVVQKFFDLNTNGVIDGSDWLVQQFTLTDGQAGMVIGGVTNINVPGDTDGTTNGQITATLNFQNGDFIQNICGRYLYKLSSPVGHFGPITNNFSVTNFPFPEKITGNVVSNNTSTAVLNAIVIMFQPPLAGHSGPGNPQGGVVANNAGGYTIQMPPGTYSPMVFSSNYVYNYAATPALTLAASQTINTNLTLIKATSSISGTVVDASTEIGLPGLGVFAESGGFPNNLIAFTCADTNGNFILPVIPAGQWGLGAEPYQAIGFHGYVGWYNDPIYSAYAGATGVKLAYPKATSLYYGTVKDNFGNPMPGIAVSASDNNEVYNMDGNSDMNGNYVVGALGGVNNPWFVSIDFSSSPVNYLFSEQTNYNNLNAGQPQIQNFTAIPATNFITGSLKDNFGNPIAGVAIYDYDETPVNGIYYQGNDEAITDTNGNYSLNVANGTWYVEVDTSGDNTSLPNNYTDLSPADTNVTILNTNAVVNFTATFRPVQVNTISLPNGTNGLAYGQQLYAIYGSLPYSWSLLSGLLPSGLTLATNGLISGTPTNNGTFNFTVKVTDALSETATQSLSLTVVGLNLVPNGGFETGDFSGWTTNGNFTYTSIATNSTYAHSGTYGASLGPAGALGYLSQTVATTAGTSYLLSLWLDSPDGVTPNEFLVSWNGNTLFDQMNLPVIGWTNIQFLVTATGTSTVLQFGFRDDNSYLGLDDISVVAFNSLGVAAISLINGMVGTAYSQQLSAVNGQLPYSWSLMSGSLPSGLNLSTNGLIVGAPTSSGIYDFTVKVTDSLFSNAMQALTLTVLPSVALQPTNNSVSIYPGNNVIFSVSVAGTGPFNYQWQLNGTNLPNGIITTVAGSGTAGYSGDGSAATNAELYNPTGVAADASGNLFIADYENVVIRQVKTNGIITTVSGNGIAGYSGDGGAATNAELYLPTDVAVDANGNLFIADWKYSRIRKVGTNGIINTVAGGGNNYPGDGSPATNASLSNPYGVTIDANGNLFIADTFNDRIRKVGTNGIIFTVAGGGTNYIGDGGAATNAELYKPQGVAVDANGNLFIADSYNMRIRKVNTNGIISTVAGNGIQSYSGDGGLATNAELDYPFGVAVDKGGNLFIADYYNDRIREVYTNGIITTVAGGGNNGLGDGGTAINAELSPYGVAFDANGNLLIADFGHSRIRKVTFPLAFPLGPILSLNNVDPGNAGAYDVVVSGPYGSVTSSVVNLIISLPPVILSAPQISAGKTNFNFLLSGPASSNYVLQVSTDLLNWSPVITSTIPVSGSINLSNSISGYNRRFYRAMIP